MTVHTFDREHEIDLAGVARAGAGIAMVTAFAAMFLLVLSQIFAVIS